MNMPKKNQPNGLGDTAMSADEPPTTERLVSIVVVPDDTQPEASQFDHHLIVARLLRVSGGWAVERVLGRRQPFATLAMATDELQRIARAYNAQVRVP